MKKAIKTGLIIVGTCCITAVLLVGVFLSIPPRTVDFRGTVTEIVEGDAYTFHIAYVNGSSYLVIADSETKIYCESDKKELLSPGDIRIGDTIEGDFYRDSEEAKFIRIWR